MPNWQGPTPRPARVTPERAHILAAAPHPRNPAGPFADLTWAQQRAAEQWLFKFCEKWKHDLPNWRRAILIGVAKRLAVNPPKPGFGKALHRIYTGQCAQRKYRAEGRDPLAAAHRSQRLRRELAEIRKGTRPPMAKKWIDLT